MRDGTWPHNTRATNGWLTDAPAHPSSEARSSAPSGHAEVAYRQGCCGEVAVPAGPDTLILHHGSLRAMVQGSSYGD